MFSCPGIGRISFFSYTRGRFSVATVAAAVAAAAAGFFSPFFSALGAAFAAGLGSAFCATRMLEPR